jgi:hypothetical protein
MTFKELRKSQKGNLYLVTSDGEVIRFMPTLAELKNRFTSVGQLLANEEGLVQLRQSEFGQILVLVGGPLETVTW